MLIIIISYNVITRDFLPRFLEAVCYSFQHLINADFLMRDYNDQTGNCLCLSMMFAELTKTQLVHLFTCAATARSALQAALTCKTPSLLFHARKTFPSPCLCDSEKNNRNKLGGL